MALNVLMTNAGREKLKITFEMPSPSFSVTNPILLVKYPKAMISIDNKNQREILCKVIRNR